MTAQDAEVPNDILYPNLGALKGRTVRRPNACVNPGIDPVPYRVLKFYIRNQLTIDIMFLNKLLFFFTLPQNVKFGIVEALPDKKLQQWSPFKIGYLAVPLQRISSKSNIRRQ